MTLVDGAIIGGLAAWLMLSVIANVGHDRHLRTIRARDPFGLLPLWWVFAPRPIERDPVVAYRDVLDDGRVSGWTPLPPPARGRLAPVWNPAKRLERATIDLCGAVSGAAARGPGRHVLVHLTYLLLLRHVCARPRPPSAFRRQFRISLLGPSGDVGGADGDGGAAVVFESAYHRFTIDDP